MASPDPLREHSVERSLPNSSEAERAILGAIILDTGLVSQAIELLKPEDFYVPSHRRIFVAMIGLFERGAEINPILIGEELKKENALETVGGVSFVANLTYGLPHSTNIIHYAKVLRGKSLLRRLIKTASKITNEALKEEDEPETIHDRAKALISELDDERMDMAAPSAIEAERGLLGAVMQNNALADEALSLVSSSMFAAPLNRELFSSIAWLRESQRPIDDIMLWEIRKTKHQYVSLSQITALTIGVPPEIISVKHYALLIREAWALRQAAQEADLISQRAKDGFVDAEVLLAMAEEKFASMREHSARADRKGGILSVLQPEAEAYLSLLESGQNPAIPTGISTLDHVLNGGLMPGDLFGFVARSGEGKSLLLKQWLQSTAKRGIHGALFSLEMSSLQNVLRLLSAGSGVPLHHLAWGANRHDLGRVRDVMSDVMGLPIHIYGDCRSIMDIWSRVKEIKRRHPLAWVAVDYFQLANGRGRGRDRYENKTAELEYIANTAKEMAEAEQLPVVMPAQFNQEGAKQEHPQIENVRGGMAYFNACDICATLVTSEYKSNFPTRDATMYIKKNRNGLAGDAGVIDLVLDNTRLEFYPMPRGVDEQQRRDYL